MGPQRKGSHFYLGLDQGMLLEVGYCSWALRVGEDYTKVTE